MAETITTTADRLMELAAAAQRRSEAIGEGWWSDGKFVSACDPQTITALCSAIKEMAAERDAANERAESLLGLCRNAQEMTALHAEMLAEAMKERDHWKANHADMVKRATILRDRPDCPLERVSAFEEVGKAFAERDALREQLERMTQDRDCWEQQASDRTDDAVRFAGERDALRASVAELTQVGVGRLAHTYMGLCPDLHEGHDVRDDECPACQALVRAAKLLGDVGDVDQVRTAQGAR